MTWNVELGRMAVMHHYIVFHLAAEVDMNNLKNIYNIEI